MFTAKNQATFTLKVAWFFAVNDRLIIWNQSMSSNFQLIQ